MAERYGARSRRAALAGLRAFEERARLFSGWDFADLRIRTLEPGPPWDYEELVQRAAADRQATLDLGTGGGELLARMRPALSGRVVATEEWVVNAPVAFRRLAPLGIHLVRSRSLRLPFRECSFDLVIDRHEEFDPGEVDRVLSPGGRFLTQQVGRHNWKELRGRFPRMTEWGDQRSAYVHELRGRGLEVESREHESRVAYPSLGEFVFMLCVAPWEIPEFDLERDLDALLAFESDCTKGEGLVVTECRYVIEGHKPQ